MIKAFWGKKSDNGSFQWLPLVRHLKDTEQITDRLWEHWLSQGQKNFIESSLQGINTDGKSLAMFLAAVHDIGKATPSFQIKESFFNSKDLDSALIEKLEMAGFSGISELHLPSIKKSHHALAGQSLLSSYGVGEDITSIIGAHHGKPVDSKSTYENQLKSYPTNYFQVQSKDDSIHKKWDKAQREIFNKALNYNGYGSVDDLPKVSMSAQVILSGLIIMADWIASNDRYFPLILLDESDIKDENKRIENAWNKWEKGDQWTSSYQSDVVDIYKNRFGLECPKSSQKLFFSVIDECNDPGIFIFEAPMGIGKTEAALVAAEQLAYKNSCSGIFFGLPTQATSNGMFPRIEKWLKKLPRDENLTEGERFQIRLVHGKAYLNPVFENLAKNIDSDNEEHDGSVIVNEWFSGRKTSSLDDFVVGTVDQFLMASLKQKHLALRHLGFSKKVVIIDEVHAYDAYMSQYLQESIRWMAAYNVPVIILSATLPADKREEMVRSYISGKGIKWREVKMPIEGLKTDSYPLITYSDGDEVKQVNSFENEDKKTVAIVKEHSENIYSLIEDLLQGGGIIGVIVNTVKRAQEIANKCSELFGEDIVGVLHSGFISTERVKKEEKLLEIIGKGGNRPHKKIIVGTQVIEQSLDIDFDVMISDLAPMDLLIQRIGRLHRHNSVEDSVERHKHKNPVIYVLGTNEKLEFEKGSIAVYDGYILTRTQYYLPNELIIPDDISPLVQKVYENKEINLDGDLKIKYEHFKDKHDALIENKKLKSSHYKIDEPVIKSRRFRSNSLVGWLNNDHPDQSEEHAYAQVRDTKDTIEIIALKQMGDGYGLFGTDEDISRKIDNFKLAKKVASNTLRLPFFLSYYNATDTINELEKYNQMYLNNWQDKSWLKGSLGIIFDENNEFVLNGYKLIYDIKYGLSYERMC